MRVILLVNIRQLKKKAVVNSTNYHYIVLTETKPSSTSKTKGMSY